MSRYDFVKWLEFQKRFKWKQGEHVLIAAPTNVGKTTLAGNLLNNSGRKNVCLFVSKTHDDVFKKPFFKDWRIINEWPPPNYVNKVLLWPTVGKNKTIPDVVSRQRKVFADAIDSMFFEKGWCLVFDEQHWLCDPKFIGLARENAALQHVGRSSGLTVMNLTQRPAWIPLVTFSSASHAFIGKTTFKEDVKRLAELQNVDVKEMAENIAQLGPHELVYVSTRSNSVPIRMQVGR